MLRRRAKVVREGMGCFERSKQIAQTIIESEEEKRRRKTRTLKAVRLATTTSRQIDT